MVCICRRLEALIRALIAGLLTIRANSPISGPGGDPVALEDLDMAYGKRDGEKLAWMGLKHDDARLPEKLQEAVMALEDARAEVEDMVRKLKPAPKGRRWIFSYKHGVAIALADATGGTTTTYFD
jgi:hypothetical protein